MTPTDSDEDEHEDEEWEEPERDYYQEWKDQDTADNWDAPLAKLSEPEPPHYRDAKLL